ncbi:hypothetical protein L1049_024295 [Liquidambar formosana]|uniref:C3H1-type domain-containing protein n=1 Tax=Liquidambar formosana TaxID=63359 RepID=A0AAP0S1Q4_LIQFO
MGEQHKFHPSHQLFSTKETLLREIDIPPRKLLSRRTTNPPIPLENSDRFAADSLKISPADEALLRKFLPYNNAGHEDDDDKAYPYSSDHFRMFEFKVRRCTRSRSHDWTDCPFAHPGEKARRRDPRRYHYSGTVCPEYRRGGCSRGDNCEFAHGVFECWLHPARYRTEPCKDGKHCKRKVCFFAHTPRQLRVLPQKTSPEVSPVAADRQYKNFLAPSNHRCMYCHSVNSSPTSTLVRISHLSPPMSPSMSPPLSPMKCPSVSGFSQIPQYLNDRLTPADSCALKQFNNRMLSYKDVLTELMTSLEAMNANEASSPPKTDNNGNNLSWVDVSFASEDQQQFILSPSTPIKPCGSRNFFSGDCSSKGGAIDEKLINNDSPDLGWVNDLLM